MKVQIGGRIHGQYRDTAGRINCYLTKLPRMNHYANNTTTPWSQPVHAPGNPMGTSGCPWESACALPLGDTTGLVYAHLRAHNFIHNHSARAGCPWPLCSREMRWGNVARHILERHLRMRVQCVFCGHTYSRNEALQTHMNVFYIDLHQHGVIREPSNIVGIGQAKRRSSSRGLTGGVPG